MKKIFIILYIIGFSWGKIFALPLFTYNNTNSKINTQPYQNDQPEEYLFIFTDSTTENINLVPYYFEFDFDSIQVVEKSVQMLFCYKPRKANYILSNEKLRNYLNKYNNSLFRLIEDKIRTTHTFIYNNNDFGLPVIYREPYLLTKENDSTNFICDVIIIRLFKDGYKYNILPIVKEVNINR